MPANPYFTPATFRFLKDLADNNNREWFQLNKPRYEDKVKAPAMRFIDAMDPLLERISLHYPTGPRNLFRIYRDTRFSKDKSPYKTYTGIQFRHERAKDVHSPGFYLHLQPGELFVGVGIWHPDSKSLGGIRDSIVDDPARWKRVRDGKKFRETYKLEGESLKTAPRGYDKEHPLIDDLRRKDFIAARRLTQKEVTSPDFPKVFAGYCRAAAPFQRWLCGAVGVDF